MRRCGEVAIEPDTKNWTWVLERPCLECGADVSSLDPAEVAPLLRANAPKWVDLLGGSDDEVRRRRRPDCWSVLEYACHVRDVFTLFHQRLQRMLTEDDPLFANWDQDATAEAEHYDQQDPAVVAPALAAAAETLAAAFEGVKVENWQRTGRRSDGAVFTVVTFGRYMIHDPIHHLYDVAQDPTAG
jgi:hypothetical protein